MNRYQSELREAEKRIALGYLVKADWNITKAAKLAGYNRTHLHRKIKELGIERPIPTHRGNWQELQ